MFMRTTPTQVRFCFILVLFYFSISENNSYFLYFVLCAAPFFFFFFFFLTSRILVNCELSSRKTKIKISIFFYKVHKNCVICFYHSVLSAREFRHYKIFLDYVYRFYYEDVILFSFA